LCPGFCPCLLPLGAGAWTLPEGIGSDLRRSPRLRSTNCFNGSGLASTLRYNKFEAEALIEYEITDRSTGIFNPGVRSIDIEASVDAQRSGLGYTEFGARYAFV
jgi:hypothetical protein